MNYICNWEKNKLRSWSGTHYSLFTSLNSQFSINEISLEFTTLQNMFLFFRKTIYFILNKKSLRKFNLIYLEKNLGKILLKKRDNKINFMFETYNNNQIANSTIYIDLSISYLNHLAQMKSPLLKYTSFSQNVSKEDIDYRIQSENFFFLKCKAIFTMSKWLADYLVTENHLLANKVYHVGGGCNIDTRKIDSTKKKGNKFLFVGIDWERKNGPLVLEAFNRLILFYPELELYIAGPNKTVTSNSKVFFLGNLSYDQIAYYYNLCDFFVLPSKFEAYGLVFAEALIFGLPCIGKNAFAMSEFIEDDKNGILINHDDVDELMNAMKKMFIQSNKFVKFVKANKDYYLNKYSWDSVASRIKNVISNID